MVSDRKISTVEKTKMNITYIKHSSFCVELERHILLFDYFLEGELPAFDADKEILVFTSHKHSDHFNVQILQMAHQYPKIHFFLGAGLRLNEKYLARNGIAIDRDAYVTNLYKRQECDYSDIHIRTLRSTDAGVAYLIDCEGYKIYHAGDLNCWCWTEESEEYNQRMKKEYEEEIDTIAGEKIDVAFVPLDPHLESTYWMGMSYFMEHVGATYVFPMHMWEEYTYIEKYIENEGQAYADNIMRITAPGERFAI